MGPNQVIILTHPRAIMELPRHSSINVTLGTYGHLFPALDKELVQKLDDTWNT